MIGNARGDVSTSFSEEKEAKRLLLLGGFGVDRRKSRRSKSFLLLFFKKEALSFLFT
jgi:hypothetical protein